MNLLTPSLLAAIDWDEYKRYGRELTPSTVDWIEQNGKPNVEFEFLVLQKAIERSERVRRSKERIRAIQNRHAYEQKRTQMMRDKGMRWNEIRAEFRKKYRSLSKEGQKNFLVFLNREYLIPTAELEVITGLKDYQIKYILYKDGGPLDEEGN
ncbi:hypothetical protein CYJ85_00360 [Limosilactobacillus fermentum]|uniref:hypothetical protein n=1 Tax=Limosilactobacillus fermentum TaxID=1613 RepID=UPI000C798603|nr:hypothetical protein [Limosilactobacillus fermentum]PLT15933.1 hypothetical protein CYJ85_00360 [Limosilactobacillus fermentum]